MNPEDFAYIVETNKGFDEAVIGMEKGEETEAQDDAAEKLPEHGRLAQALGQLAEELGAQENDEEVAQEQDGAGIMHGPYDMSLPARL